MKMAATHAIADLAKEAVPDDVAAAYEGEQIQFGRIILFLNHLMQGF